MCLLSVENTRITGHIILQENCRVLHCLGIGPLFMFCGFQFSAFYLPCYSRGLGKLTDQYPTASRISIDIFSTLIYLLDCLGVYLTLSSCMYYHRVAPFFFFSCRLQPVDFCLSLLPLYFFVLAGLYDLCSILKLIIRALTVIAQASISHCVYIVYIYIVNVYVVACMIRCI